MLSRYSLNPQTSWKNVMHNMLISTTHGEDLMRTAAWYYTIFMTLTRQHRKDARITINLMYSSFLERLAFPKIVDSIFKKLQKVLGLSSTPKESQLNEHFYLVLMLKSSMFTFNSIKCPNLAVKTPTYTRLSQIENFKLIIGVSLFLFKITLNSSNYC